MIHITIVNINTRTINPLLHNVQNFRHYALGILPVPLTSKALITQCTIFWTFQILLELLGHLCDVTRDINSASNMAANTRKRLVQIKVNLCVFLAHFITFSALHFFIVSYSLE